MGSIERRERERAETRVAILDAARTILNNRGYEGLTMRAVADEIEYTPAAIYKHFADREQLVRELCANDFLGFNKIVREQQAASLQTAKDPYDVLRQLAQVYAKFALEYPEQYRVMFMTPLPVDQVHDSAEPETDAYTSCLNAVEHVQKAGCFPGLSPALVAQTLWATIHGVVSIEIAHLPVRKRKVPFEPITARVKMAIEAILLGLEALARVKPKKKK